MSNTYGVDELVTAQYPIIIVGEDLATHYDSGDVVTIAEMIGADILTIGDVREIFPDGERTTGYLGPLDDHLDEVATADAYLIAGVGLETAQEIPWSVIEGDDYMITRHSYRVWSSATDGDGAPVFYTIGDADAETLRDVATDISKMASFSEPATIYSEREEHPDPPIELLRSSESGTDVQRCTVCHTLSNHKIGRKRTTDWQCPAVIHRNHDRLETLLERRQQLERRHRRYDETTEAGQRAIDLIEDEQERVTEQIEELRDWFDGRFDDVVSRDPDLSDLQEFEPIELEWTSV